MNIIGHIEHLLSQKSADSANLNQSQEIDDFTDFHTWEMKTKQKYKVRPTFSFVILANIRLKRIFFSLHSFTDLNVMKKSSDSSWYWVCWCKWWSTTWPIGWWCEYAMTHNEQARHRKQTCILYNWSFTRIRYARKPNGKMAHLKHIPFIGSVLWSNGEHRQVNYVVKRIIKLLIDCVSIDFNAKEIAILSVSQRFYLHSILHRIHFRNYFYISRNCSAWSTWCITVWTYVTTK